MKQKLKSSSNSISGDVSTTFAQTVLYSLNFLKELLFSNKEKNEQSFQIIENDLLKGNEIAYLDNSVENFFLHIQGSGTIELENGKRIRVGYAGSNGRPYRSVARWLDETGEMPLHKASMENIKSWVKNNPKRSNDLFNYNPRLTKISFR